MVNGREQIPFSWEKVSLTRFTKANLLKDFFLRENLGKDAKLFPELSRHKLTARITLLQEFQILNIFFLMFDRIILGIGKQEKATTT